ncbi:hypothetical protein M5689_021863 [Euphorbia peplus]|nr:hypothetical protein M5689_021863 [Euphorbia peplus]
MEEEDSFNLDMEISPIKGHKNGDPKKVVEYEKKQTRKCKEKDHSSTEDQEDDEAESLPSTPHNFISWMEKGFKDQFIRQRQTQFYYP